MKDYQISKIIIALYYCKLSKYRNFVDTIYKNCLIMARELTESLQ